MEEDPGKARGHGRPSTEHIKQGGRRPGEEIPSSQQPREKIFRKGSNSPDQERGSRSSRSSTDSREDRGHSKSSSKSSHYSSHSRVSRDEPRPSTSKEATPASSEGSGSSRGGDNVRPSTSKEVTPARSEGSGSSKVRDTSRVQRSSRYENEIVKTRPSKVEKKTGKTGEPVTLQANYFKLLTRPTWSIYQYHVNFDPDIESTRLRIGVLSEHRSLFGGYLFDGKQIFTTTKLRNDITIIEAKSRANELYKITVKYVNVVSMTEWQSLQVLNLILRKAMGGLQLQLIGRNFFDAVAKIDVRDYRLQLWPGYQTSIRQHEKEILLCAEIAHKTMRTETVYDILQKCVQESRDYHENFKRQVLGLTVLTDYNNRTYRIDDVDFSTNPRKTFQMKDRTVTYIEYYRTKYNIKIRDTDQPLLISKSKERQVRAGQSDVVILVPELCRATGLSEQQRTNFQLMRALAVHTRLNPDRRIERLRVFNRRLQETESSMTVLREWNMQLDRDIINVPGRILKPENIVFGGNNGTVEKVSAGDNADWQRYFRDHKMFTTVELKRWALICPNRSSREANDFIKNLIRAAEGMRMTIRSPQQFPIYDDRNHSYINAIESCARNDPQLIMCIVPNNNAERYSSIKKKTCVERAIPTQVMCHKTISPKGPRGSTMSVATKVAIQMNCKLGAVAWMIELPLSGLMTIGYDLAKSTRDKSKAYGALVATMDMKQEAKYYSTVDIGHSSDSLSDRLTVNVTKALREYRNTHGTLPSRILLYRDGVGDGQLNQVFNHEVKTLVERLNDIYKTAKSETGPRFAFIVVSKRINSRLFLRARNPPPGTVVDDVITLPERYDFFLVSQSVKQGTVSPTGYNIIYDTMGLDPDRMQILTYKQTHLYYNWSGTTRVPAVCQYAKKLATLVATYIHQSPSNALEKQLYFL